MAKRKCEDWLLSLMDYVEETESPRHFWFWAGIFAISSALQRKVWLPFGLETIYPNLYILEVAPPGECRKGPPIKFAKKILSEIGVLIFADSPTKRALTKSLDKARQQLRFPLGDGTHAAQSAMVISSTEFSTFLAVDPKAMIEALTDLYDSPDEWVYQTSEAGTDKLFKVCLGAHIATTPEWIANNLPEEAIGGGFTTRLVILSGSEKYKWISLPPPPDPDLYVRLKHDLKTINSKLIGEFQWGKEAYEYYDSWYNTIPEKTRRMRDPRLRGNLSRIHIAVIKTAMCLHASYSDELVIDLQDLEKAIAVLEETLRTASDALSGHGRSRTAVDVEKVMRQIKVSQDLLFSDLLMLNYHDTNKPELTEVLQTIEAMGVISTEKSWDNFGELKIGRIRWLGANPGGVGGAGKRRN